MSDGSIWLIGCGNMAGAMLAGWLQAGVATDRFIVVRPSGVPPEPGVRTLIDLPPDGMPDIVMLGVKPGKLDEIAPVLADRMTRETVLVSILAGVEIASLRRRFPKPAAIVRAMPNLPVRLGVGATGLITDSADAQVRDDITALMAKLGLVEWVDTENALDAVSVLAGSGPAFVYRFIDALAGAGVGIGLPREQAERLALVTANGAAMLAAHAADTPARLADRVASPGGSTRRGMDVLDAEQALQKLLNATLAASRARVAEMAREARGTAG